jgi:signal transduction histidine kinase
MADHRWPGLLSLRVRLTALVGAAGVLVLTAGALLLYTDLSRTISQAITAELRIRASDVATGLEAGTEPVGNGGVPAQVLAPDGTVVAPEGTPPLLDPDSVERARRSTVVVDRRLPLGLGDGRVYAMPAENRDGEPVVVVAAASTAALREARARLAVVLLIAGPALAAVVATAAWVLAGAALRPVRRITREAGRISMAEPGRRLPQPPGDDEIAELGRVLNQMLDRIEATVAHERAFVDDASHELRTPLAVLRGELELALMDADDPEAVRRGLTNALDEADRLGDLAKALLVLARADTGQLESGRTTTELLAHVRRLVARTPPIDGVEVTVAGEPAQVRAEPATLDLLVGDLVENALGHARSKVRITVDRDGSDTVLSVADDGPGFPPGLVDRPFERFSRADTARTRSHGGAGLGLAIVASVASTLGGTPTAANGGGALGGAVVTVRLPAVEPPESPPA